MCVPQGDQFVKLAPAMRQSTLPAQIVVCCPQPHRAEAQARSAVVLPPLRARSSELDRIIDEYLGDASADLGGTFLPSDRRWIRRHEARTLARIEFAARRLVALRTAGSISHAARMLGIAYSALWTWAASRRIPLLKTAD